MVGLPQYHRIYLQLQQRIISGELAAGARLPGEHELAQEFGVSRITTKRALNELARSGLVTRERGRGTIVRPGQVHTPAFDGTLESLESSNRIIGKSEVRLLDFALVEPSSTVRSALDVEGQVYRIERVRLADRTPFCHVAAFVPEWIGSSLTRQDLESTMLVTLIEQAGSPIVRAAQTVSATLADSSIAELLQIEPGAPLLRVVRTAYSHGDRPVEHFIALFRPDCYSLSMELARRPIDREQDGEPAERSVFVLTA